MKLKFKTLFLSSAIVLSTTIAVSSCGAKSEDSNKDKVKTPETGTGDKDKTPSTAAGDKDKNPGTGTETPGAGAGTGASDKDKTTGTGAGTGASDKDKTAGTGSETGTSDKDKTTGTGTETTGTGAGTGASDKDKTTGTGSDKEKETPKNPEADKNATEKAMLKTVAEAIKLNYDKKLETFAGQVNLEDAKAKFKPETFDAEKYKLDIEKVSSDIKKGIVDVTVKVSLKDGSVASDNVVLKVSGFRISPIDFILTQKDAIIAELKKPVSKLSINVENSDVVIPSGTEAIDFSKPTTFVKVGTFNTGFFDWLQMSIEEAAKNATAAAGTAGTAGQPAEEEGLFNFSVFKDIWNKKEGSLDKFFESPMAKGLFDDKTEQFVPKDVDFKAEIKKIWEQEKTSFGFKGGSFFVPTGTAPIDFDKSETYKEVLKTPADESLIDTFDPLKNLGGAESDDLKAILAAFSAKSKDGIVLERDGNKSVTFVYYQAKKAA